MTRAGLFLAAAAGALLAAPAAGQTLAQRVASAPDGTVHLSYAARPGVCGNGEGVISFDCANGTCGMRNRITSNRDWEADGPCPCDSGPVRLALLVHGGQVTRLRTYVGGHWLAGDGVTDLGTVPAAAAVRFLLDLARSGNGQADQEAVFPATLADSVIVWPDLVRIARDNAVRGRVRNQAVFWLAEPEGAVGGDRVAVHPAGADKRPVGAACVLEDPAVLGEPHSRVPPRHARVGGDDVALGIAADRA